MRKPKEDNEKWTETQKKNDNIVKQEPEDRIPDDQPGTSDGDEYNPETDSKSFNFRNRKVMINYVEFSDDDDETKNRKVTTRKVKEKDPSYRCKSKSRITQHIKVEIKPEPPDDGYPEQSDVVSSSREAQPSTSSAAYLPLQEEGEVPDQSPMVSSSTPSTSSQSQPSFPDQTKKRVMHPNSLKNLTKRRRLNNTTADRFDVSKVKTEPVDIEQENGESSSQQNGATNQVPNTTCLKMEVLEEPLDANPHHADPGVSIEYDVPTEGRNSEVNGGARAQNTNTETLESASLGRNPDVIANNAFPESSRDQGATVKVPQPVVNDANSLSVPESDRQNHLSGALGKPSKRRTEVVPDLATTTITCNKQGVPEETMNVPPESSGERVVHEEARKPEVYNLDTSSVPPAVSHDHSPEEKNRHLSRAPENSSKLSEEARSLKKRVRPSQPESVIETPPKNVKHGSSQSQVENEEQIPHHHVVENGNIRVENDFEEVKMATQVESLSIRYPTAPSHIKQETTDFDDPGKALGSNTRDQRGFAKNEPKSSGLQQSEPMMSHDSGTRKESAMLKNATESSSTKKSDRAHPFETPPISDVGTSPDSMGNSSPVVANSGISKIDAYVKQGVAFLPEELDELYSAISRSNSQNHETQSFAALHQTEESKRVEYANRDSDPASLHNTPSQETRPEGDQQDQIMSSAPSSKRRNTNNSRCASLLLASNASTSTRRSMHQLDSDDDEMSSSAEMSEVAKRPRTPKGRYSPDAQRKANSKSTMSALSIETHRNTDLNADGSGPSSSSAVSCGLPTPDPDRLTSSSAHRRRGAPPSTVRSRKRRSPSLQLSQEEQTELDSDDEKDQCEMDSLPIVIDDPGYKITPVQKVIFKAVKTDVAEEYEFKKSELAELYRSSKTDQARLPEQIHFGNVIMKTWYGSPFPAEFINVKLLYICEFCFFFARSDQIMQNHAKKCVYRAPPGVEIYRKGDISVFEVDGRIEKAYCQTLCLISRMFLESKTVFYDTEPFFFYIVTINDEIGCRFAGYFSKEKYEPDVNNLSCIMTLPRYQDKGLGRFLIDVSYALSRREGWNGGPEQPLSDLGKKAYGGYWRMAVACSLARFKEEIEAKEGVGIGDIANDTGINSHDILSVVCSMQWAKLVPIENTKLNRFEWDVDWEVIHEIEIQKKRGHAMKIQFDEDFLDWVPRKMHPSMDGFQELSKAEIEADEQRRRSLQKTPQTPSQEAGVNSTPVSLSKPVGSVKKELRSRGHNRSVGRNLMLELRNNIKVPENREATDDETKNEEKRKKKRKRFSRCEDESLPKDRHRDDSPEDDEQPGPSSRSSARRHRSIRETLEPTASTSEQTTSSGKGRHRKRGDAPKVEDSEGPTDEPASSEEDDERPFGEMNGQKGKNGKVSRGKRTSKKKKSVSGKKFPPNFGEKKDEVKIGVEKTVGEPVKEEEEVKAEVVKTDDETLKEHHGERLDAGMTTASEAEDPHPMEEEMERNYDIGTPESYHSVPSPEPEIMTHQLPYGEDQFEDNDVEPPALESEVGNLNVSGPAPTLEEGPSDAPPLVQSVADPAGYSSDDDDGPPRLSPQYGKVVEEETAPEPMVMEAEPHPSSIHQQMNGMHHDEPQTYHDPMSAGPSSSMHMTPQMMPNGQNMMNTTPQQHYSQPNSHQQATPGSGGIPSCGPVFSHSTPEQQNQQFMSPQMAGMPGSVSSVHSVHNNNSMEMVGGPSSLQHTPQQQYDIGMGQLPQENGVMVNGMDQSNQMMMQQQQHGFSSPPMPVVLPQQPPQHQPPQQQPPPQIQQQVPPVTPAPPVVLPPPTANGRRRSESSAGPKAASRKQRVQSTATAAPTPQQVITAQMPYNPIQMMGHMPMHGYFPYAGYPPYPHMAENGFGYAYPHAYGYPMFNPMNPVDPATYQQRWQQMAPFNASQMQNQNGAAAAAAAATAANYQFPPAAPTPYFQNNNH